jgi:hypothetical protein
VWATAIFGLVGVVVGALVTGGVDFLLEHRRENAESSRVKRLVAGELQTIWAQLNVTLETRETPRVALSDFEGRFLPDELWLTSRGQLASAADNQQYIELAGLYAGLDLFRRTLADLGPSQTLNPDLIQQARDLCEHVETAYHWLTSMTLQDEA